MTTALVTGATAGIGYEFARQLAERGDDLVLVARTPERLEEVAAGLRSRCAVAVEVLPADLADPGQVDVVAARLADRERPIDLLVNNAGFGVKGSFLGGDLADERRTIAVLVDAVMVLSHAAGQAMRERGHGAIVNVSSVASFIASGTYAAAKSWVTVFSESLATELSGTGVTVTALCPGFTHTEFHDRARLDMSALPAWMWLDAPSVVHDALEDVARGRVISVPGLQYKTLTAIARLAPRALVRRVGGPVHGRRRRVA